ncbi:MAG: PIG-L family deacetylase [Acidimicrobiales bacterium]
MDPTPWPPSVCFVSAHLDDAVLSCGHAIAAHPSPDVLTVFTDAPPVERTDGWNHATTGQSFAPAAQGVRRVEDLAALTALGATAHWLGLFEAEYRHDADDDPDRLRSSIRDALRTAIDAHGFTALVAPVGLRHVDHVATSDACLSLAAEGAQRWWLALDQPYAATSPELVDERLAAIRDCGFELEEADMAAPMVDDKVSMFRRYASQFEAVREDHSGFDEAMSASERYWVVRPAY